MRTKIIIELEGGEHDEPWPFEAFELMSLRERGDGNEPFEYGDGCLPTPEPAIYGWGCGAVLARREPTVSTALLAVYAYPSRFGDGWPGMDGIRQDLVYLLHSIPHGNGAAAEHLGIYREHEQQ